MARGERETLLALHLALSDEELESLKYLLEGRVPRGQLCPATRPALCQLLLQHFPGTALRVAADLLRGIARHDLVRLYQLPGAEGEPPGGADGGNGTGSAAVDVAGGASGNAAASAPGGASVSAAPPRARPLSERELLLVAQRLGRDWQEVGIGCLGLGRSRLEQIQEEEPRNSVLQSFQMLRDWRRREQGEATAPRLRACLAPANPDPELLELLQSFQGH